MFKFLVVFIDIGNCEIFSCEADAINLAHCVTVATERYAKTGADPSEIHKVLIEVLERRNTNHIVEV